MYKAETLTSGGKSGIFTGFDLINRQRNNNLQEELLKKRKRNKKTHAN